MGNRRAVMMFFVALLMSVGAAWVANEWIKQRTAPRAEAKGNPVVVAALKIPFGQKIEGAHVKVINMSDGTVPAGAYTGIDEVVGKIANQAMFPGEILISERIVDQLHGSTLSAMIAPKKRAVTVRVNDVIGVAGFLLPGNRVDVISARSKGDATRTETILQDLKVLAVDQTVSPEKDKPVIVRAVTLEMAPDESEVLVKATNEGSVQLTLRNPLDSELLAKNEPPAAPVKKAAARASITIIRGTTVDRINASL